jgi:hypothetical protein
MKAKKPAGKSAAKKPASQKPAARKSTARKPATKKSTAGALATKQPSSSRKGGMPLALAFRAERSPATKPKSNFCIDHGRLLRADRTCPVSTCRFNTKPMPEQ